MSSQPVRWEPDSFEEFRRAFDGKRCEIVTHGQTREWARRKGWGLWWFGFDRQFIQRVCANEKDFWQAYNDGAFNLTLCTMKDVWGR